ncbi:unnamed protein product [Pseudo-nitzschia multistriata]|uniref:Uncharacterized protein n=1 Tax=Pseudo-nitzschia multistriata TaxID=183589 RepID=A0A448ZQD6_9STRA|nr:unnamed protein product [Pseudo-nitzschia multistriata]
MAETPASVSRYSLPLEPSLPLLQTPVIRCRYSSLRCFWRSSARLLWIRATMDSATTTSVLMTRRLTPNDCSREPTPLGIVVSKAPGSTGSGASQKT